MRAESARFFARVLSDEALRARIDAIRSITKAANNASVFSWYRARRGTDLAASDWHTLRRCSSEAVPLEKVAGFGPAEGGRFKAEAPVLHFEASAGPTLFPTEVPPHLPKVANHRQTVERLDAEAGLRDTLSNPSEREFFLCHALASGSLLGWTSQGTAIRHPNDAS
ncbi:hypothetical protein OAF85_00110 [Planctomycetota bacterium]|nr:hypothetical protein [Planctomycetota bacterium]